MRSSWLLVTAALLTGVFASTASAQSEPQPGAVPPEAAAYATTPIVTTTTTTTTTGPLVVVAPTAPVAPIARPPLVCPRGSEPQTDASGRPMCVVEVHRHAVDAVWLGLGIGGLVGGYVGLYAGTAITTSTSSGFGRYSGEYSTWGDIPLLGPWVQMAYFPSGTAEGQYVWNTFVGLLELGGLAALVYGAVGEDRIELQPLPGYVLRVTPIVGPTVAGLDVTLVF